MSQLLTTGKKVKLFSVVLFTSENRYAVVPKTWISEDKCNCYWPSKKTKHSNVLVKDPSSKPDSSFQVHPIRVVKSYGEIVFIIRLWIKLHLIQVLDKNVFSH